MNTLTERRRFWRSGFHAPAHVSLAGQEYVVRLLDISLKGALLEQTKGWTAQPGQKCILQIKLAPEAVIVMESMVTHIEGDHIGLQCERIDLDSITHLRQLVEHNATDPAVLDRDLAMLVSHR
jgi:PilZ domain